MGISGATKVQRPISTVTTFIRPSVTWQRHSTRPPMVSTVKVVALGVAVVVEVLGEDAQAVARLLRLAAVGIQDPEAEVCAGPGRHEEQDAVRAHPPVAVADPRRPAPG